MNTDEITFTNLQQLIKNLFSTDGTLYKVIAFSYIIPVTKTNIFLSEC